MVTLYFFLMKNLFFLLLISVLFSCTPARFVKPLEKGQLAIGADLGGPLIGFADVTIPVPLTNLNAGYGISEKTTGFAGIHTTALAFATLQLDAGAVHAFALPEGFRPGISASAAANVMVGLRGGGARLFPQLDINAFWEYGQGKRLVYLGLANWFEPAQSRAHGEDQPAHWLPCLQLGHVFTGRNWDFTIEFKQLAFNQDKRDIVVDYKGFGNKGAGGLYFGVRRKF